MSTLCILLFFSLLNGSLIFIILPSLAIALPTWSGYSISYEVGNNYINMPVVTRLRARSLRPSINEVEPNQTSSTISIHEITSSIHEHHCPDNSSTASNHELSGIALSLSNNSSTNATLVSLNQSSLSLHIFDPGQAGPTSSIISKFQISEISNCHSSSLEQYHNFSKSNSFTMESDCEDCKVVPSSTNGPDINQLFASLSAQMTYQTTSLQDKLSQMTYQTTSLQDKLSTDFSVIVQAHDQFKKEVRDELDELRALIAQQSSATNTSVAQNGSSSVGPTLSPPDPSNQVSISPNTSASSGHTPVVSEADIQTQMMTLLTESFSELSSVILDKNTDTKSDWPKFSRDPKKFRAWYMSILAQLSLPSWNELYDSSTNDFVLATTNVTLNGKLYLKQLLSLDGQPLQNVITRSHLRANGLDLLRELSQTYKPKNVPEVIVAKTGEFWSKMRCKPTKMVDSYYNRFHELLEDLSEADDKISVRSAMRHFIFTLGVEFEPIQNMYRIGSLPSEWNTSHWPSLLVLCRDYYNSVHPSGILTKDISQDVNMEKTNQHRKKVKQWFLNPSKFCKEIASEQQKHPGMCIYHLSASHPTETCHIKLECDKRASSKKPSNSSTPTSGSTPGQLRHMTEELFEDASDIPDSDDSEVVSNNTNEADLLYFERVSNHYLCLVKATPTQDLSARHQMQFPVIADSGANYHMFKEAEFFDSLTPARRSVILGDGKTRLPIQGVGTVKHFIGEHLVQIENDRYIPDLSESIYSLFLHIQQPQHGLESSFEGGLFLKFPGFSTKAIIGRDDIYLDFTPATMSKDLCGVAPVLLNPEFSSPSNFCRKLSDFQENLEQDSENIDYLLSQLKQYYTTIQTK
jgi:hypothetical protein